MPAPNDEVRPPLPQAASAGADSVAETPSPTAVAPALAPGDAPRAPAARLAAIFTAVFALCVLAYLAFAVPGKWFTGVRAQAWGPKDLQVVKGSSRMIGDELGVAPSDPSGLVVVTVKPSLKAFDYAAVHWIAIDVPDHVDVSLLWRSDYKPGQLNSMPLTVATGRLLPAVMKDHQAWIGNIQGLALAMKGPIAEPVRIRGVVAKPLSVVEVVQDRLREWFAFEAWSGTSINTVTGGADVQDLPLPLLLAAVVAVATLVVLAIRRWRPGALPWSTFASLGAFVLVAWLLLDLRWMSNLVRQVDSTADRFAGKSWQDKRLAVEDGPLFAFVQKAKGIMPAAPARVFVGADSHYFRGRAAYHLYPHNAFYDPRANAMPSRDSVRPGDWILVFSRRNVQYDAAQQKLRWDNQEPVAAELKLAGGGAALFQVR